MLYEYRIMNMRQLSQSNFSGPSFRRFSKMTVPPVPPPLPRRRPCAKRSRLSSYADIFIILVQFFSLLFTDPLKILSVCSIKVLSNPKCYFKAEL